MGKFEHINFLLPPSCLHHLTCVDNLIHYLNYAIPLFTHSLSHQKMMYPYPFLETTNIIEMDYGNVLAVYQMHMVNSLHYRSTTKVIIIQNFQYRILYNQSIVYIVHLHALVMAVLHLQVVTILFKFIEKF